MARKQNRSYKKDSPHRDYRKFIIIAEGEREDDYFSFFSNVNKRVVISIVPRDKGKSACKYFLDRVKKYDDEYGIEPEDRLWFIMDVDNWLRTQIDELQGYCAQNENWNLAVSNPCFEVWLYYHFADPSKITPANAQSLKQQLHKLRPGGYKKDEFALEIKAATKWSGSADNNPTHYFPDVLSTKVYKLSTEMLKFLGNTWQNNIVKSA